MCMIYTTKHVITSVLKVISKWWGLEAQYCWLWVFQRPEAAKERGWVFLFCPLEMASSVTRGADRPR